MWDSPSSSTPFVDGWVVHGGRVLLLKTLEEKRFAMFSRGARCAEICPSKERADRGILHLFLFAVGSHARAVVVFFSLLFWLPTFTFNCHRLF